MGVWFLLLFIPLVFGVQQKCPGGTFSCPDSATCCELLNKAYGCCPLKNAVCCDDHIHCCPENSTCSVGMCVQNTNKSTEIHLLQINDVICPDESTCPEDTTCCKNPRTGNFSCCPMENAVCCNDGLHCCPMGTTCNLEERKCDGDGFIAQMYDWDKKSTTTWNNIPGTALSHLYLKKETSVVCPGSEFQCPNGDTCCKMPNDDWGCCPFPNANCCKDGIHCCPEYMHCDVTSQYCNQESRNITSLRNKPAKEISAEDICPDHSSCTGHETCCKISETQFGCCEYVNATCCADLQSCCPSHMVCDLKSKRCIPKEDLVINLLNN